MFEGLSTFTVIVILIFVLPVLGILRFLVQPYLGILFYKKQDPENVKIYFYPFLGAQYFLKKFFIKFNDTHELFRTVVRENPNIKLVVSNFGSSPLVYFLDTKLIKQFTQNNVVNYRKKKAWKFIDLAFGRGVFFVESKEWRGQRKVLGHAFHFENLRNMIPFVQSTTKSYLDELDKRVDKEGSFDLCVLKEFEQLVGDIILAGFFSMDLKANKIAGKSLPLIFALTIQKLFVRSRFLLNFLLCDMFGDQMANKTLNKQDADSRVDLEIIRSIGLLEIRNRTNKVTHKNDFLQYYVEEMWKSQDAAKLDPTSHVITEDEILAQFITFFFAGMDTTGHLIGMAIYQLALNKGYHDRLMKEIEENVKEQSDYEATKLNQCLFFSALLKECLRMYPPAPQVFLRVANHDHMIGEFKIKKGTVCTASFTAIQNNPKYYKDPQIFNPDRWLDESQTLTDQFAFLPFSAGQRNCIGQHLAMMDSKIILINFLRRYNIAVNPKTKFQMTCTLLYGPIDDKLVTITLKNK